MEHFGMSVLGTTLGLALTAVFVARNLVARTVVEPYKNRGRR